MTENEQPTPQHIKRYTVDFRFHSPNRSGRTVDRFDTFNEALAFALQQSLLPEYYYAIHDLESRRDVWNTDNLNEGEAS